MISAGSHDNTLSGRRMLGAFEVKYGSGQTMLSYDGKALTAYNEDGSDQ
ncbi:hypothetical protein O4H62_07600 [Hoeflea alexandrii]|nr:hypothetical protein [Hoeflea alexandrii]